MRKVFALLAVVLVVGCADVGAEGAELDGAEDLAKRAREKDAAAPLEPAPVTPEADAAAIAPEVDAGAIAVVDAALPPVVADAGAPVVDSGMTDPEPLPAPLSFFDGRPISVRGEAPGLGDVWHVLTLHVLPENPANATVERYDNKAKTQLLGAWATQTTVNQWTIAGAGDGYSYAIIFDYTRQRVAGGFAEYKGTDLDPYIYFATAPAGQ